MLEFMRRGEKYCIIFKLAFRHSLKNGKALIGLSIFLMTCLIIFAHLWKLAAIKNGAIDLHPDQLLWYIALNEWVLISIPDIQDAMEQDLKTGRLAYLLPRPLSYVWATFAEAAGKLSCNLIVLGAVAYTFTWMQTESTPFTPLTLGISILFGFLAGFLAILFQMTVGLSAFWLQDVEPFFWIWEKLMFMLGGLLLPLSIYPQWMQAVAHLTPFPAILGQRSALAFDGSFHSISSLFLTIAIWMIVGLVALGALYRKGLGVLHIEGG